MADEIKITLTGVDNASQVVKAVTQGLDELGKAAQEHRDEFGDLNAQFDEAHGQLDVLKGSEANLTEEQKQATAATKDANAQQKEYRQNLNDIVQGLTGFNLTQLSMVGGIVLAGKELQKVVSETINYNKSLREMSQVTGTSAQELARIVQVGDDWGVSIDSIRTALAYMNKQGIAPSIETLADLADGYVYAADKSKWAEDNVKTLGRGYQTLIPILALGKQGFLDATAAVDNSLIPTQEAIANSRLLEVATDNLSDSMTAFGYTVGNTVIPVVTHVENSFGEMFASMNVAFMALDAYKKGWIDLTTFMAIYKEANIDDQKALANLNIELRKNISYQDTILHGTDELTREMNRGLTPAILDDTQAYIDHLNAVKGQKETYNEAAHDVENYRHNMDDAATATGGAGLAAQQATQATKDLEAAEKRLEAAQTSLDSAQKSWTSGAANDAKKALEDAGVKGAKLATALETIDSVMGSSLTMQVAYAQTLKDAAEQYKKTGDLDAYKTKLGEIKDTYEPFDKAIIDATQHIRDEQAAIDALQGKTITLATIHLDIYEKSSGGGGGSSGGGTSSPKSGRASGGHISAGEPALVGEAGPEVIIPDKDVTVIPNNQINNKSSLVTNNYNLTIHSNSPIEPIVQDFSMLKSLYSPGV